MEDDNISKMGLKPLSESQKSLISALVQQGFKPPSGWPHDAKEARKWLYRMLRIVEVDDEELWMIEQCAYSPPLTQNHIPAVPHIPPRKPGYLLLRQFSHMRQRQRQLLNRILGRSNHNSR